MSKPINENPNPAPRYPAPAIQIHPQNSRDATIARLTAEVERLRSMCGRLAAISRRTHHECEDSWYSCPKSEDGCADDFKTGCTCGAEEHNAMIDAIHNDLAPPAKERSDGQ